MAGRSYPPEIEQANGWTKWIRPVRKGYRLACCDCGLIHVIDSRLIAWGKGRKIVFRARRDNRATAAHRRAKKGKR